MTIQITRPTPIRAGVLGAQAICGRVGSADEAKWSEDQPLALEFDPHPGMPRVPRLQVVRGTTNGVEAWAARFAQVVVEVVAGDRSVSQLLRCTTPEVYADLSRRTAVLHRSVAPHQRLRRQRAVVRSVHVFCPVVTAAEVSVHVRHGDRGRAIAARLEYRDRRWQCVAIEFG